MRFLYDIMRDWDMRKVIWIKNRVAIGLIVVFFFLDVYPKTWRMGVLSQQVSMARRNRGNMTPDQQRATELNAKGELAQVTAQTRYLQQRWQELADKVPRDLNVAEVTLTIEDLAVATKLELLTIKPGEVSPGARYGTLLVEIGFRGAYAQFVAFLAAMGKTAVPVSVQEVIVQKIKSDDLKLEGRIKFYLLCPKSKGQGAVVFTPGVGK